MSLPPQFPASSAPSLSDLLPVGVPGRGVAMPARVQGGSGSGGGRGSGGGGGGGGSGSGGGSSNRKRSPNQGGGGSGHGSGRNGSNAQSKNRRPSNQGRPQGSDGGPGPSSKPSTKKTDSSAFGQAAAKKTASTGVRSAETTEEKHAIAVNRRWATVVSTIPGLVLGLIAGLPVALVVGLPLVGFAIIAVVAVIVARWVWRTAPETIVRAVGAQHSSEEERPRLHNVVDGLCATMGLPRPTILVVDSPVPNALAIGSDPRTASLIVTSGLDETMSLVELEGVIAQELVHIKRRDTVRAGIAVAVVAPFTLVSSSGAALVHTLVGHGREFSADQRAVKLVRYPAGLGSALRSMSESTTGSMAWPPGGGRISALTQWLWINPIPGGISPGLVDGDLDDAGVRAAALALL